MDKYDYEFKFMLTGDPGVGKSSILRSYLSEQFLNDRRPTIGVDNKECHLKLDNKNICLNIFDIAGDPTFHGIFPQYYRGAHGVVIVYSITDKTSFASVRGWLETAKQHTKDLSRILLVGNKADLSDTQREVSRDEAQEFANEHRLHWIETSAKTDSNVQVAFDVLVRDCMETLLPDLAGSLTESFVIDGKTEALHQYSCCSGYTKGWW